MMNMNRIKLLPDSIAHKIAAGEVIERPVSVVKELVENSIDALATFIEVEVKEGGKEYIRVSDNGIGINPEDLELAFVPHATSKINSIDDLFTISSLGFRGEALASIASVSELILKSKQRSSIKGYQISFDLEQKPIIEPVGMDIGTTVEVRRLFYNTPARYKFLKTTNTEQRYIIKFIGSIALAHPHIAFKLVIDEKIVIQTYGSGKLIDALTSVYDRHTVRSMIPLAYETAWGNISGYLALPETTRKSRRNQLIILNGRVIDSPLITSAVEKSYQGMLTVKEYPIFLINISIDPTIVDVNVHPAKSQVRFQNEREIYQEISTACRRILLDHDLTGKITIPESKPAPAVNAAQTSLDLNKYFPWQPKTWKKVDEYLKQESGFQITETETKNIDLFRADTLQEKPEKRPVQKTEHTIREQLLNAGIIGQFRQTYILLETITGLWILDQHIIHERILYEKLINKDYKPYVQRIFPQTLDFPPAESSQIYDNLTKLNSLGIELEEFGTNSFILRGIPHYLSEKDNSINEQDILDLVSDLNQDANSHEKAALTLSCKGAVKAGQRLSEEEIRSLLSQLAETENPFTCPHGRPIILRFDDREILKRFGR